MFREESSFDPAFAPASASDWRVAQTASAPVQALPVRASTLGDALR